MSPKHDTGKKDAPPADQPRRNGEGARDNSTAQDVQLTRALFTPPEVDNDGRREPHRPVYLLEPVNPVNAAQSQSSNRAHGTQPERQPTRDVQAPQKSSQDRTIVDSKQPRPSESDNVLTKELADILRLPDSEIGSPLSKWDKLLHPGPVNPQEGERRTASNKSDREVMDDIARSIQELSARMARLEASYEKQEPETLTKHFVKLMAKTAGEHKKQIDEYQELVDHETRWMYNQIVRETGQSIANITESARLAIDDFNNSGCCPYRGHPALMASPPQLSLVERGRQAKKADRSKGEEPEDATKPL